MDMDDIIYESLSIRMLDPSDQATINALAADLVMDETVVTVTDQDDKDSGNLSDTVDLLFMALIAIMMFLCFFSLSASMSANLYD